MKKKCKNCNKKRDSIYEYSNKKNKVCVYCNDLGFNDSNYKERILGGLKEPKTLAPTRPAPLNKMRFKK